MKSQTHSLIISFQYWMNVILIYRHINEQVLHTFWFCHWKSERERCIYARAVANVISSMSKKDKCKANRMKIMFCKHFLLIWSAKPTIADPKFWCFAKLNLMKLNWNRNCAVFWVLFWILFSQWRTTFCICSYRRTIEFIPHPMLVNVV